CEAELPADIAVCAAAVADWRVADAVSQKLKKDGAKPALELIENPDILATLSKAGNRRPRLVVGFAAETDNLIANATVKLARKGCDWLVANEVGEGKAFDQDENEVTLLRKTGAENWERQSKHNIARQLADEIVTFFNAA
ncbi:MAG TPA: phosphopantothenoylcysteine decarboxylase, partial [Alphaproteobacteria bacterium]|nr:phosphopantothenoylcysteine decarboxylase [Alphaproteobacteria bacterium]